MVTVAASHDLLCKVHLPELPSAVCGMRTGDQGEKCMGKNLAGADSLDGTQVDAVDLLADKMLWPSERKFEQA